MEKTAETSRCYALLYLFCHMKGKIKGGSNINKNSLVENQQQYSLNRKKLFYDAMTSISSLQVIEIPNEMVVSCAVVYSGKKLICKS